MLCGSPVLRRRRRNIEAAVHGSGCEIRQIAEVLEGLGVGERVDVLDRQPMHHIAHGQFGQLAGQRPRNVRYRDDLCRDVAWRGVGANGVANLLLEGFVQLDVRFQPHEQDHAHISLPILPDGECLDDLVQTLHSRIDLGGADAYTPWVQYGIGSAVDHDAVVLGQGGVVTVMPDPWEALEVGRFVTGSIRIIPEPYGHGREGRRADQFTALATDGASALVENLHAHAKPASLNLSPVYRQDGAAQGEARDDVRAAGNRGEENVLLDRAIDIVETIRKQRRARGQHRAQGREIHLARRHEVALLERGNVLG